MLIQFLWYGSMAILLVGSVVMLYGTFKNKRKTETVGTGICAVAFVMMLVCYAMPPLPM